MRLLLHSNKKKKKNPISISVQNYFYAFRSNGKSGTHHIEEKRLKNIGLSLYSKCLCSPTSAFSHVNVRLYCVHYVELLAIHLFDWVSRHLPERISPKSVCPKTIRPKKIPRKQITRTTFYPEKKARK